MKEFHWPLGNVAKRTMTVAELRAKLAEYPDDMPVFGGWEGVCGGIQIGFEVMPLDWGVPAETCQCLVIDVEN